MVADNSQSMSVSWSPYGKILTNTKAGGASLAFGYNAMQQRVVKRVVIAGDTTRTYYIRDAQGNTMGVYTRHNDSVSWREQYILGSSRLGLYRADTLVNKGLTIISKLYEGKRNYELTNHLGNVMAVINDRKTDSLSGTTKVGFNAVVISATDYYPFGMAIDSRSYTSSLYRYGFNGKELDKETGEQDYGMRIYDPRIAKFLSVDPIADNYPWYTPYQFAGNKPIWAIDLDGLEEVFMNEQPASRGQSGIEISMRLKPNPEKNDIGKMQYIYIDCSKSPIVDISSRLIGDVQDLRGYRDNPKKYGINTTEIIYGPYSKSKKPSVPAPVHETEDKPTPQKVVTEPLTPQPIGHPKIKKPRDIKQIPPQNDPPPPPKVGNVKFKGNSNEVLGGWGDVGDVAEILKRNPKLSVTISANIGYSPYDPSKDKIGTGPEVWNYGNDTPLIDVLTKRSNIKNTNGTLMDLRGKIIKDDLVNKKGINANQINISRGSASAGESGRTVIFTFERK